MEKITKQSVMSHHLINLCHPYMFALKEGQEIINNPLDYTLLLLQRNCVEVIRSPQGMHTNLPYPLLGVDSVSLMVGSNGSSKS